MRDCFLCFQASTRGFPKRLVFSLTLFQINFFFSSLRGLEPCWDAEAWVGVHSLPGGHLRWGSLPAGLRHRAHCGLALVATQTPQLPPLASATRILHQPRPGAGAQINLYINISLQYSCLTRVVCQLSWLHNKSLQNLMT